MTFANGTRCLPCCSIVQSFLARTELFVLVSGRLVPIEAVSLPSMMLVTVLLSSVRHRGGGDSDESFLDRF